jgi:hypothetical protein
VNSTLTTAGAAIAVIASALGVLITLEQLTLRARLRKSAETAKTFAEAASGEREVVLASIHDVAVARLVAGWLVPGWRFAEAVVWLVGVPIGLGAAVADEGLSKDTWAFVLVGFVSLTLSNRRGARLLLERQRIAREYMATQKVEPPRIALIHQMEGGTRREFLWGAVVSLGAVLGSVGAGLLFHDPESTWPLTLLIVGIALLTAPADFLRAGAVRPAEQPR